MKKEKNVYVAPVIEVIEVENEGSVMAASIPGMGDGGTVSFNASSRSSWADTHKSGSALSDLEDAINDLLTIQK